MSKVGLLLGLSLICLLVTSGISPALGDESTTEAAAGAADPAAPGSEADSANVPPKIKEMKDKVKGLKTLAVDEACEEPDAANLKALEDLMKPFETKTEADTTDEAMKPLNEALDKLKDKKLCPDGSACDATAKKCKKHEEKEEDPCGIKEDCLTDRLNKMSDVEYRACWEQACPEMGAGSRLGVHVVVLALALGTVLYLN